MSNTTIPRLASGGLMFSNTVLPIQRRKMSPKAFSTSQQQVERIAIVGGGITGLTSAFYASKKYPSASISLIESSNRLGGAVESTYLPISKGATTVCERGPRTLRASAPRAPTTYDLVSSLDISLFYSYPLCIPCIYHPNLYCQQTP